MINLNIEATTIYDFIFDYKNKSLEIKGIDEELLKIFNNSVKCEESLLPDFFSAFNNELYNIRINGGSIRFERELKLMCCTRFFIIKGTYFENEDKFIGVIIDDTSSYILNQKAIHAEKLRSIGALAGGIAHDFNNQLMVISGSCELLKRKIKDVQLHSYLKNIEDSTKNSSELIKKLLTFGNITKVDKEEFNLIKCIEDTITILEHTSNKKTTIMYESYLDEILIYGNFGLIQNSLLNICKNAIESIKKEGLLLIKAKTIYLNKLPDEIANHQLFSNGLYAAIEITDNGCGMSEETLNNIFDPFFTTKGFDKGIGLGLSTVIGTIEGHNGLIGVKSSVGKGTTFTIYLKVTKGEVVQMENTQKQIMIIDDENLVRMVLQDILIDLGYKVKSFESGAKAIEYYKVNKKDIDLVICDMMMPKLTGSDVFKALKKINKDVKFIILSGYSNEDIDELHGVCDYLTKPIMLNSLGNVIENALK